MKHYILWSGISSAFFFLGSCNSANMQGKGSPVILGDSATIVTETDSQYLRDMVGDIEWAQPPAAIQKPVPDTPRKIEKAQVTADAPAAAPVKGYKIECGNYTITVTGIDAKEYKKQNPVSATGLSYAITSGNIKDSRLVFSGSIKDMAVRQRYQSKLMLDGALGKVQLPDLGLFTSEWEPVKINSKGNSREVDIAIPARLQFTRINAAKLKNAADRSLRKGKAASKTIQSWLKAIRTVRNAGDEPTEIVLSNIQWQISGKDASGKPVSKMLRMDVP